MEEKTQVEISEMMRASKKYIEELVVTEKAKVNFDEDMTFKECAGMLFNVIAYYDHHTFDAWDYFAEVYEKIPKRYRLRLQLEIIYTSYHFRTDEFFKYLARTLCEESIEDRKKRWTKIKRQLKPYLNKDKCMTVYRGYTDNSLDNSISISYSCDKKVAEFFAERFNFSNPMIDEKEIHFTEILYYTNIRKEQEVMVISQELEELISEIEDKEGEQHEELY